MTCANSISHEIEIQRTTEHINNSIHQYLIYFNSKPRGFGVLGSLACLASLRRPRPRAPAAPGQLHRASSLRPSSRYCRGATESALLSCGGAAAAHLRAAAAAATLPPRPPRRGLEAAMPPHRVRVLVRPGSTGLPPGTTPPRLPPFRRGAERSLD